MTQTGEIRFLPAADADNEGTHIALTTGHACRVYKTDPNDGKPGTVIPMMFHKHAIAAGCGVVGIQEAVAVQEPDGDKQALIVAAITKVIEESKPDELTQDGRPKIDAVRRVAGFGIVKEELDSAWSVFVESLDDEGQGE